MENSLELDQKIPKKISIPPTQLSLALKPTLQKPNVLESHPNLIPSKEESQLLNLQKSQGRGD